MATGDVKYWDNSYGKVGKSESENALVLCVGLFFGPLHAVTTSQSYCRVPRQIGCSRKDHRQENGACKTAAMRYGFDVPDLNNAAVEFCHATS